MTTRMTIGETPVKEREGVTAKEAAQEPIDRLDTSTREGEVLHERVLAYVLQRLNDSEKAMGAFYNRWRYNEIRHQAYINLPDWEQELREMNDSGQPPKAVRLVVPYSYATLTTMVTFLLHAFTGNRPLLQVKSYKSELMQGVSTMETWLEYNSEHTKLVLKIWQFLYDAMLYNLSIMKCNWVVEKGYRTEHKPQTTINGVVTNTPSRERVLKTTYAGNQCENVDPFMFFPDPNVPMSEVNRKGEYVFVRSFLGKHTLLIGQDQKIYKWVERIGTMPVSLRNNLSQRSAPTQTPGHAGQEANAHAAAYNQIDEGSVTIIPAELGLGESNVPEKWLFTIGNKRQIIRCTPLTNDHGLHPVVVSEPFGSTYSFGHAGIADFIGPLQDLMSWLVNAHMSSVRVAINNRYVYDPSRIEAQDVEEPTDEDVQYIRIKQTAYGTDVNQAIKQLETYDVTQNHMKDLTALIQLSNGLTGIDDNLRGIQSASGRKTATEVRTSVEAGASRLAALARIISAQAISDLTMMMSVNTQQYIDEEFFIRVLGEEGMKGLPLIKSDAGDFRFPVHDGTLPIDKIALLDIWRELFTQIIQNPQLAAQYNAGAIFKHIATLGGVKDLSQFEMQALPDGAVDSLAADGTVAPVGEVAAATGPGARLAGSLTAS